MKVKIYQIEESADKNRVKFEAYADLEKYQGDKNVNPELYKRVFAGDVDAKDIEDVFVLFNTKGHPLYRGHSMSMSDIVVNADGAFYCDDIGFIKTDFDESKTIKNDNLLRTVYIEPGKPAYETEIEDTLEAEQKAVGGYIEVVPLDNERLLICNEEGKLNGMQGNRRIGKDVIAGPFFIVGSNGDEFRSLTDEEAKESLKRFAEPEEISQEEDKNAMSAGVMFFG